MNLTGPRLSSMLLPKIHRNSMLKMMCSQPPCTNMPVSGVSHHDTKSGGGMSTRCVTSKGTMPARKRNRSTACPFRLSRLVESESS